MVAPAGHVDSSLAGAIEIRRSDLIKLVRGKEMEVGEARDSSRSYGVSVCSRGFVFPGSVVVNRH